MWKAKVETLSDDRVSKVAVLRSGEPVAYVDVLSLWEVDAAFRDFFMSLLADSPFPAFRWETPPITRETINRDFEFVLLRCDALERAVDQTAFESHFNSNHVMTFPNLGRDAVMVVPCPIGSDTAYGHLAAFTRDAPEAQQHELWKAVGVAAQERLSDVPVWLSTAGMGVS